MDIIDKHILGHGFAIKYKDDYGILIWILRRYSFWSTPRNLVFELCNFHIFNSFSLQFTKVHDSASTNDCDFLSINCKTAFLYLDFLYFWSKYRLSNTHNKFIHHCSYLAIDLFLTQVR